MVQKANHSPLLVHLCHVCNPCTVSLSFYDLCSYADKVPEWIDRYRQEGMTDTDLEQLIKSKAEKYQGKWGNNSRVGILINNYGTSEHADAEKLKMKPRNQAPMHNPLSPVAAQRGRLSSLPAL